MDEHKMTIEEIEAVRLTRYPLRHQYLNAASDLRQVALAVVRGTYETLHPDSDMAFGDAVELLRLAGHREQRIAALEAENAKLRDALAVFVPEPTIERLIDPEA